MSQVPAELRRARMQVRRIGNENMRRRIKTSSSGVKTEIASAGFGVLQQASHAPMSSHASQMHAFSSLVRGKSERETRLQLPIDGLWLLLSLAFRRAASGADKRSGDLPSRLP